nr:unnamed protein product [Naegleria fowleri]
MFFSNRTQSSRYHRSSNDPSVQQQQGSSIATLDKNHPKARTLWMGDLDDSMDEDYVKKLFGSDIRPSIVSAKIIRDRNTGKSAGYGFIEFTTVEIAKAVLETYNGKTIPSLPNKIYKLNWTAQPGNVHMPMSHTPKPMGKDVVSVFVGDLAPDVDDYMLEQAFKAKYPSVRGAKVVLDPKTKISKGYGFVKFADEEEMMRSMTEMQGVYISSRPVKIHHATNNFKSQGMGSVGGTTSLFSNAIPQTFVPQIPQTTSTLGDEPTTIISTDPLEQENTTVYVGNLTPTTDEKVLREYFQGYGPITSVKIPTNSNCGFINFTRTEHAERAILEMNGIEIQGNRVRVSWGRMHKKQQNQMDDETLKQRQLQAAVTAFQFQQHQLKSMHEKKMKEEEERKKLEFATRFIKPFDILQDNQRFLDENNCMDVDMY